MISESERVEKFLKDVDDPSLKIVKEICIGDSSKNGSFNNYHQYTQMVQYQVIHYNMC